MFWVGLKMVVAVVSWCTGLVGHLLDKSVFPDPQEASSMLQLGVVRCVFIQCIRFFGSTSNSKILVHRSAQRPLDESSVILDSLGEKNV